VNFTVRTKVVSVTPRARPPTISAYVLLTQLVVAQLTFVLKVAVCKASLLEFWLKISLACPLENKVAILAVSFFTLSSCPLSLRASVAEILRHQVTFGSMLGGVKARSPLQ